MLEHDRGATGIDEALAPPVSTPKPRAAALRSVPDLTPGPVVDRPSSRRRALLKKSVLMAADVVAMAVALVAAAVVRAQFGADARVGRNLGIGLLSLPLWPAAFALRRLYSARFFLRVADEARRVAAGVMSGVITIALATFALGVSISRGWLLLVWCFGLLAMSMERAAARTIFRRLRRTGRLQRPVVILGLNLEALELYRMLEQDQSLGYEVLGFVDDEPRTAIPGVKVLGDLRHAVETVRSVGAQGVVIAATAIDLETSNRLIRELTDAGIHVQLSSTLRDIASYRLTVQPLGRFPVVYVEPVVRGGWRRTAKRGFDLAFAIGGLLAAAPVLLVAAIAIKVDSRGPVLFAQERVGTEGHRFRVLKLRTMCVDAEAKLADLQAQNESDGPLFKMASDPRITRVGALLRKMSIDELPQLWNVLRNDMSIVGPRPALPSEMAEWTPELFARLRVKPGLTGMWQVHGRSSAAFSEYVRLDLYYVDNWSIVNDLAIVAKTIPAVLLRRGAV